MKWSRRRRLSSNDYSFPGIPKAAGTAKHGARRPPEGERAGCTAIHFLLEADRRSHWHRVDAAELWLWHAGSPLALLTAPDDTEPVTRRLLGAEVLAGQQPQLLVPAGHWQAAEPAGGWVLASCIVSPAFVFTGFELAAEGWSPGDGLL